MDPRDYSLLGFALAALSAVVVHVLGRTRKVRASAGWFDVWVLLAAASALDAVWVLTGARPSAAAALTVLLAASWRIASIAGEGRVFGLPATKAAAYLAPVLAAAAAALALAHAYNRPAILAPLAPAAVLLLLLFGAVRFARELRSSDSLSQRVLVPGVILLAAGPAVRLLAPLLPQAAMNIGYACAVFGLFVLSLATALFIHEDWHRTVEEDLLRFSSTNLASGVNVSAEGFQAHLLRVLERILKVCQLSQGLICLAGNERRPSVRQSRGLPAAIAARWAGADLDRKITSFVERVGGLLILRDVQKPEPAGRLESDAAYAEFRDLMKDAGARSVLGLGLQTKTATYGALVLAMPPERALSVAELHLIASLSAQIAMAVENFLLVQESQRRAEELRLLNQTGQAMSSTLNPDALLRLVHQEIEKLMDARNFYIALWDETRGELHFELESQNGAYVAKRVRKTGTGISDHVLRTREPLLLKSGVEQFRQQHALHRADPLPRCWLGVPLMLYDRAIGVMAVRNFERDGVYDEGHLDIMRTIAAQAAIALENARLFFEEKRRLRHLSFLHNMSRIAISTLNAGEMLAEIAREIQKNFMYDHIGIGLLDYQTKQIEIKAEAGLNARAVGRRIPLDVGVIGRVARTGEMALVNAVDPDSSEYTGQRVQGILMNALSELCLPIIYGDQTLGVLNVESTQANTFEEEDVLILRTLADHLSTALHNAFVFQRMQQQAITDGLTGVKTHRFFMESIQAEWKRAARSGRQLSVIALDLDRFKQINDTMGHLEGDLVLARLGKVLEQRSRQSNIVARYGGDEFMILLPETGIEQAQILADRLRLWIATDPIFAERKLTASFGLATYPLHGETPEEIIRAADAGLYLSKHQGGNSVSAAEQFRRPARAAGWQSNVLYTYLESLGRRLDSTGPEVFDSLIRRLEEAWPAFPGDASELERAVIEGMAALSDAVDRLVHGSSGHTEQVTRYALMLAHELRLEDREQDAVGSAARVHDVGYLLVPSAILLKSGRLTPAEFSVVQSHPGAGARVLEMLHVDAATVAAVRHHHEFYNGTGYPESLASDDIPLGARILAVAETFESLTSERPHRRARTVTDALEEMERFSGTQFDPALVRAFGRAMRSESGAAQTVPAG